MYFHKFNLLCLLYETYIFLFCISFLQYNILYFSQCFVGIYIFLFRFLLVHFDLNIPHVLLVTGLSAVCIHTFLWFTRNLFTRVLFHILYNFSTLIRIFHALILSLPSPSVTRPPPRSLALALALCFVLLPHQVLYTLFPTLLATTK